MAKTSSWNPIAFVPTQVSIIATALYAVLFTLLIYVHTTVPSAPSDKTPLPGINLTSAWLDLSYLSDGYHPVDSKRNELVREYLLNRIDEILDSNGVKYKHVEERAPGSKSVELLISKKEKEKGPKAVTVFDDKLSNVTFVDDFSKQPWTCYTEGTNIIVYIRGSEDPKEDFWLDEESYSGPGGVLVNAHFDSVSSGFGATDDGVGVVTTLQLISYYTSKGNRPKRGLVALLNNNEEDGLFGSHEFLRHPMSQFTHIFMNLEGAAAGGRAQLFRSTDSEVTKFYAQSPYPFGSVVSLDGFRRGFVRSGTDYSVFNADHRMRGIDVAFYEQRSKYHTNQDSARETSPDSLWHMLSAAISTTEAMTSYDGDDFDGSTRRNGKLDIKSGSDSAYFDLFGRFFAVTKLDTLFALSVTLLVAGPILLAVLEAVLRKSDKWYLLAKRRYLHSADDDEAVHFSGMRGLFRFPLAFVVATAALLALAYLLAKINAFIIYSSEYAVWAMMLSAWFSIAWFFLAGADRVRPTALQRMYMLIWIYAFTWLLLVGATVGERNFNLGSGYFVVIYNASAFAALVVSYLELLALPTKAAYVERVAGANEETQRRRPGSQSSRSLLSEQRGRTSTADDEVDTANERSSLLGGSDRRSGKTFSKLGKRAQIDEAVEETDDKLLNKAYGDEQPWSSSLPQWTWILQLLLLAPINVVIIGQISLLLTTALNQTPADGNPVLPIYLFVSVLTVLLLLPLTPFMHRFSYRIATFFLFVLIACLIYNLVAFPFSENNRLKVYFLQQVNLETGANNVTIAGLDGYIQEIIDELPSASGQTLECGKHTSGPFKSGLQHCSWSGIMPNVLGDSSTLDMDVLAKSHHNYTSWVDFNATAANGTAHFHVRGRNSKKCRLIFDDQVSKVGIDGAAHDPRYHPVAEGGSSEVRLYSREWEKTFAVQVSWADGKTKGKKGRVVCLWNEINEPGSIPAYDEVLRFQPVWSATTKGGHGLVEGFKEFELK